MHNCLITQCTSENWTTKITFHTNHTREVWHVALNTVYSGLCYVLCGCTLIMLGYVFYGCGCGLMRQLWMWWSLPFCLFRPVGWEGRDFKHHCIHCCLFLYYEYVYHYMCVCVGSAKGYKQVIIITAVWCCKSVSHCLHVWFYAEFAHWIEYMRHVQ